MASHDAPTIRGIPLGKGSDSQQDIYSFLRIKKGEGRKGGERKEKKRKKEEDEENKERDPARGNLWGFLQSRGLPGNVLPDSHPIMY